MPHLGRSCATGEGEVPHPARGENRGWTDGWHLCLAAFIPWGTRDEGNETSLCIHDFFLSLPEVKKWILSFGLRGILSF